MILLWGAIPPAALQSRLLPKVSKPNVASRQISWAVGPASRNCLVTSTPSTPSHPTLPPGRRRKFLICQPLARGFVCLLLASFPLAPLKQPAVTLYLPGLSLIPYSSLSHYAARARMWARRHRVGRRALTRDRRKGGGGG